MTHMDGPDLDHIVMDYDPRYAEDNKFEPCNSIIRFVAHEKVSKNGFFRL